MRRFLLLLCLWTTPVSAARDETFLSHDGRNYSVRIDVPEGAAPLTGWPVVMVLDGNAYFETMVGAVRAQAFAPDWTGVSDAVVVGVDGADGRLFGAARRQDFTPIAVDGVGGGAASFLEFLTGPVRAAVAAHAPTDPARSALFGHSLGGLFTLFALFERPDAFSTYIASSPSIWWGQCAVLNNRKSFLLSPVPVRLLVTVGEWERRPGPDARSVAGLKDRERILRDAAMVRNAREMVHVLQRAGLDARFDYLRDEDHMSAPGTAITRSVRFALSAASARPARPPAGSAGLSSKRSPPPGRCGSAPP